MTSSEFESEEFDSVREIIERLLEKSDDFEGLELMVVNHLPLKGPNGEPAIARNACGLIKTCGRSIALHREDLETLINTGIFSRMKIPIRLVPAVSEE